MKEDLHCANLSMKKHDQWSFTTLGAFVFLCTAVCFQMFPQMTCLRGCIFTLVAFIWFLSTVCFQMSLQITCLRGYEITLVAFVCILPFVFVTGDFFWALFSLFQDFAQTPAYMISFTFSRSFQTEKNIKMKICIGLGNLT